MMQPLTKVVKNIIIINVLFFLGTMIYEDVFYDLFAGRWFQSEQFRPWQIVTHMFMHGGLSHIAFNMFAVYMFGSTLENYWGSKKFLIYYMLSGVGAFFLYQGVSYIQIHSLLESATPEMIEIAKSGRYNPDSEDSIRLARMFYSPLVGASGAVFGLLLGFGYLFPETKLMLLFPPIPIKAKHFVMIYGAIELYMGIQNNIGDNVAHFAHLGGALVGFVIIKYWERQKDQNNLNHFR
ncbi:MAG: membrane associated rhomboid family serine protease [Saprospiraceae bacterium]|jgi:membrane associated rhomboid family serine protease